jgi:arginyl-tRNA synthetase
MIKPHLEALLRDAVRAAQDSGAIPAVALPDVQLERPQRPEHGDYASSLPLRLARTARMAPMEIAQAIASAARSSAADGAVESIDVAPPGFVNIRLSPAWLAAQVDAIRAAGPAFGDVDLGAGKTLQVEFVSANPVGPIHVGNGRGLALGDTLARALSAAGYKVQREYLVNDAGTQPPFTPATSSFSAATPRFPRAATPVNTCSTWRNASRTSAASHSSAPKASPTRPKSTTSASSTCSTA